MHVPIIGAQGDGLRQEQDMPSFHVQRQRCGTATRTRRRQTIRRTMSDSHRSIQRRVAVASTDWLANILIITL